LHGPVIGDDRLKELVHVGPRDAAQGSVVPPRRHVDAEHALVFGPRPFLPPGVLREKHLGDGGEAIGRRFLPQHAPRILAARRALDRGPGERAGLGEGRGRIAPREADRTPVEPRHQHPTAMPARSHAHREAGERRVPHFAASRDLRPEAPDGDIGQERARHQRVARGSARVAKRCDCPSHGETDCDSNRLIVKDLSLAASCRHTHLR
jgi:hypothetical protein